MSHTQSGPGARPAPAEILFIGGTGVISAAAAEHAVGLGHSVTVLNRGSSSERPVPAGAKVLHADVRDPAAVRGALRGRDFDVVADFLTFTPGQAAAAVELFTGRTAQYVFVSSASAYQKPPARLPIVESDPLENPFWQYSRDKIACEEIFQRAHRDAGFPVTVVRPSHTYDRTRIVLLGGWTDVHRMRAGLPVVVHGDGTSLWTLTHSRDFAVGFTGLLGNPQAVGESYTITSDEFLPWDQVYRIYARAAGAPEPELVHVASDTIAAHDPELGPGLLGDRAHSVIFDNSRIKALVPGFEAVIPFQAGAAESVRWRDSRPAQQRVDGRFMALSERLIAWARREPLSNIE